MAREPLKRLEPGQMAVVCGARKLHRAGRYAVWRILDELRPAFVFQGGAGGVDLATKGWAKERDVPCATIDAPWGHHPKAGGPIRNGWMLLLRPDLVIALPGGDGTADMVRQARAARVRVLEPYPGRRATPAKPGR